MTYGAKYVKNSLMKQTQILYQKYQDLCLNFDPYAYGPDKELDLKTKQLILELELEKHLSNPFEFTNVVLQRLDELEGQLKKSVH